MTHISDDMRRALGIPPGAQLKPLASIVPNPAPVAEGAGFAEAALTLTLLAQGPIRESPDSFQELEVSAEAHEAGITRMRWYDHAPIAQVMGPGLSRARFFGEHLAQGKDLLLIDARTDAGFFLPAAGLVITFRKTAVDVHTLEEGDDGGDFLGDWQPSAPPQLEAPALETLLGRAGCEPWLADEYARLSTSGAVWSAAIAVGLVGRLWAPPAPSRPSGDELISFLRGSGPAERSRRWFSELPDKDRVALESAAREEAHGLRDELSSLAEGGDDPETRAWALSWLHRRDDLECFASLSQSNDLRRVLISVDHAAADHNSIWSLLGPFDDDDRLRTVSWQEPEAWWGGLAIG